MVNGLLEHVIDFERSVIKSQVLEGIIVDWMVPGTYTEAESQNHHGKCIVTELGAILERGLQQS
jgi:hypothetical protein